MRDACKMLPTLLLLLLTESAFLESCDTFVVVSGIASCADAAAVSWVVDTSTSCPLMPGNGPLGEGVVTPPEAPPTTGD